jgi:hypothetical protein
VPNGTFISAYRPPSSSVVARRSRRTGIVRTACSLLLQTPGHQADHTNQRGTRQHIVASAKRVVSRNKRRVHRFGRLSEVPYHPNGHDLPGSRLFGEASAGLRGSPALGVPQVHGFVDQRQSEVTHLTRRFETSLCWPSHAPHRSAAGPTCAVCPSSIASTSPTRSLAPTAPPRREDPVRCLRRRPRPRSVRP